MRHGKFQSPRKISPALWVVLILAVLGMSFGGVRAYLSHSGGQVENSFTTEVHPTLTVDNDYRVTVSNTDYAVYLRAAVVVNWQSEGTGNLLAALPVEGTDYTVGGDWVKRGDFYYYTQAVTKEKPTTSQLITDVSGAKAGYTLKVDVAVQAIQAVGQTDGNSPVDAVFDAWDITAEEIKGIN